MRIKAQATFVSEFEALRTFCENNTSLDVFTMAETYPFTVQFVRARSQGRLFDDEPAAPNGLLVEVGLAYYHAFREEADDKEETK